MSGLKRYPESPRLESLLKIYEASGGVINFALFERDDAIPEEIELHRQAAICAVEAFALWTDRDFEQLLQAEEHKHRRREEFFCVTIQPELLSGRKITLSEFLGPCYDIESRRLILRGQTVNHLNHYFYSGDEERFQNIVTPPDNETEFVTSGYAQAFCETVHGLRGTNKHINALFFAFADELFGGFRRSLNIYQWSTNWSNYFDDGHEWWGSFCWTVEPEDANYIVSVLASTTD